MKKKKNKAAVKLVGLRWAKTTKAERVAIAHKMVAARVKKRLDARRSKLYDELTDLTPKVAESMGGYKGQG